MTYEIFLAACIQDADVQKARTIVSGVTERHERHQFTRVQHYEPQDPTVKGFPTIKQLQKDRAPTTPQWQELHQILVKQPSFFQLRADITEDVQNAQPRNDTTVAVPPGKAGIVRWTDLPDPENSQFPFTTQRRVLEIADPRAETILADNKFRFACYAISLSFFCAYLIAALSRPKSDLIEESYSWWFKGIEYELVRTFMLPPNPNSAASRQIPNPSSLKPISPLWLLYVRANVDSTPPASMPERMKQAQGRLGQVREMFKGVFSFKVFDRRCHDTRIQVPRAA